MSITVKWPPHLKAEHVNGATLYASRKDLIRGLLPRFRGGVIAELGVDKGDFSQFLLDAVQPSRFDAYDTFRLHQHNGPANGNVIEDWLRGETHADYYMRRFRESVETGTMRLVEGDSATGLQQSSAAYDMIYIDADHSYEQVLRDAQAAISRLKPEGVLIFNDYIMGDYTQNQLYGVVQVVNELCVSGGWRMIGLAIPGDRFDDAALVRAQVC